MQFNNIVLLVAAMAGFALAMPAPKTQPFQCPEYV